MSWTRWISAALLACGCEANEERLSAPAPEVVYNGCVEFSPDTCILERATPLTVWLDVSPATPLLVRIDGEAVPTTGRVIQGGVRLEFEVPQAAKFMRVETPEQDWDPGVTLSFEWRTRPPIDDLSHEELEAFVEGSSGWAKLRALEQLRKTWKGQVPALPVGEAELALARELGAKHHQARVLAQQAYTLVEFARDHERAREALNGLDALTGTSPFAAARWHYHNAILARRAGDLGTAIAGFEQARVLSDRLNFGVADVVEMLANTLAELGRDSEARPLFRQLETDLWNSDLVCSQWVRIANNLAWGQLVLASAGYEHSDPRPVLTAALEKIPSCPDTWMEAALLLDLSLAELEYGHPLEAQGWLAHLGIIPASLRGWIDVASSTAALQHGDAWSQSPLIVPPYQTSDIELAWNQNVRRGDALAAWGFDELAAEAYSASEHLLSATFEQVGMHKGGELYLAGRSASLRGLVDTLIRMGDAEEASCAIRLARAREFARLDRTARLGAATADERAQWENQLTRISVRRRAAARVRSGLWELSEDDQAQASAKLLAQDRQIKDDLDAATRGLGLEPTARSCKELRPPSSGEVILVAYGSDVFALDRSGIEVSPRADLSSLDMLEHASRISVVETRAEATAPLHVEAWRDAQSLIDLAPVGYSLDLPLRRASKHAARTALIVADPRDDLPGAQTEADTVGRLLKASGWAVTDLRGPLATRSRLLEHAGESDLFHYAGHGIRSGLSGWDSALLLAEDGRLGVHDVFALTSVPRGVVLTGCETAAPNPDTIGGGMNIGRAFVLAGSEWVVAADTQVADRFAGMVGAAVHSASAPDGPTRLREALLRLRTDDPELPWEQFRVITP